MPSQRLDCYLENVCGVGITIECVIEEKLGVIQLLADAIDVEFAAVDPRDGLRAGDAVDLAFLALFFKQGSFANNHS